MTDNLDILVKLFDTLKASSDKNEEATQQLIVQQLDLVGHIKNLPIANLDAALKEHSKESAHNIDACSDTVTNTSADLMTEIKKVGSKVSKMILVVLVTFTIISGSYIAIRSIADSDTKFEQWEKKITRIDEQRNIELEKRILNTIKKQKEENKPGG